MASIDEHRVRLDLRPQYAVERRLAQHLAAIGVRRAARTLRVHELLELGLTAPFANNPVEARGGEVVKIGCQLTRPGDARVLNALTPVPMRAAHLRQWLLAGFCASEGTAHVTSAGTASPDSQAKTSAPVTLTTSPTQDPLTIRIDTGANAASASRTEGCIVVDVDLSEPQGTPFIPDSEGVPPSPTPDSQLGTVGGGAVRTADGKVVHVPADANAIRSDLRGLLG